MNKSTKVIPGYAKVFCPDERCGWKGIADACEKEWVQEDWESSDEHEVMICPWCCEEVVLGN